MKHFMLFLLLFLSAFVVQTSFCDEPQTGRDIMVLVDDRPDGDDSETMMHMTLINKRGRTREREMHSYRKDYGKDSKSIIFFLELADVKGVGFLAWEYDNPDKDDDRWLYLPALKKSRRISGSSKNDYFMGSDFTYNDMGDRNVDEDTHTLLREEQLDGVDCWVVESIPVDKDYMYSRVVHWIHKEALLSIKSEYYDRQGMMLKVYTASDIRKQQGFWTANKREMNNHQENHQTVLETKELKFNIGIKDNIFRVQKLERGRL